MRRSRWIVTQLAIATLLATACTGGGENGTPEATGNSELVTLDFSLQR
jgi:hypothetical protein